MLNVSTCVVYHVLWTLQNVVPLQDIGLATGMMLCAVSGSGEKLNALSKYNAVMLPECNQELILA